MSDTNDQLSPRELYLIESYKEQTAAWRHEDNLFYRLTSIVLPLSIAALAVPYIEDRVPNLLATIGGLTLMTFWAISCQIADIKSNIRLSIINKIEKCWDVWGHKDFRDIRKNTYGQKSSSFLRSQLLHRYMFWLYLVIVGMLTWFRFYGQCPTEQFFISKTTDFWVIVAVVVIVAPIVGWAMWRAGKEVCPKGKDKTDPPQKKN